MSSARQPFAERAHRRAFGDRVRELRAQRQWTQEDLSDRAGLHRSYVAGLESGARNPTLDVIVQLARAFGVPPEAMLTGVSSET